MTTSVFPYPGGKTYLAKWIIEKIPQHHCYVEAFGGSASILYNKPRSHVEVVNDLDGDIVQFFDVLRDHPDDLREWLETLPYSRDMHGRFADEFYSGKRRDDPIERAGLFFYLRYTQFSAKIDSCSGFRFARTGDIPGTFADKIDEIDEFSKRLRGVYIENLDWETVVDRFDGSDTLFYFDPPYVEEGDDLYAEGVGFDHGTFVDTLGEMGGEWMVSYTDLPPGLDEYHVEERSFKQRMNQGRDDARTEKRVERLVMNFDPNKAESFSDSMSLNSFVP